MEIPKSAVLQLINNKVFTTTLFAWFITQSIKVVIGIIREKRFNFRWFVGTGGMPSSHAATVSALTSAVALNDGVSSTAFAITLVFALIVILDAQGVRRATGKQAEILNVMLDDIYWKKRIQEDRLKELLGHAPIEVFVGIVAGILITLLIW